jgi:hypothetical protein
MKITFNSLYKIKATLDKIPLNVNDKTTLAVKELQDQMRDAVKPELELLVRRKRKFDTLKASVDDRKNLIRDQWGRLVFTPGNQLVVDDEHERLDMEHNEGSVELEPCVLDLNDPDYSRAAKYLDDWDRELLKGLLT